MPQEDDRQQQPQQMITDVDGCAHNLYTLTETQEIRVPRLVIKGDAALKRLAGRLIVDGDCEISDCPNLTEIQGEIRSLGGSIRIERNPALKKVPPLKAKKAVSLAGCATLSELKHISADSLNVSQSGLSEVPEGVRLGHELVAENCPHLDVVMASLDCDAAVRVALKGSPVNFISQDIPVEVIEADEMETMLFLPVGGYRHGKKESIRRLMAVDMPRPEPVVAAPKHKKTRRFFENLGHLFGAHIL